MIRRSVFAVLLLSTVACKVNKAPASLDPNQTWFWDNFTSGSDADVAAAVTKYDATPTIASVTGLDTNNTFTGTFDLLLSPDDLVTVNLKGIDDPSAAKPGLLIATDMPCTIDQIQPLLYRTDQDKIHTGEYDSYTRTYTSDLDAFKAHTTETLTWTSTYKPSGVSYTSTLSGGLRLIPDQGKTISPFGAILLARTWLPKPAVFSGNANGQYLKQDYQLEVYYERTPGHLIHSFADWRDVNVSYGGIGPFMATSNIYQSLVLSNNVTWDANTAKQCGK